MLRRTPHDREVVVVVEGVLEVVAALNTSCPCSYLEEQEEGQEVEAEAEDLLEGDDIAVATAAAWRMEEEEVVLAEGSWHSRHTILQFVPRPMHPPPWHNQPRSRAFGLRNIVIEIADIVVVSTAAVANAVHP
jgi:adenosylcobinamide amidohydrolase